MMYFNYILITLGNFIFWKDFFKITIRYSLDRLELALKNDYLWFILPIVVTNTNIRNHSIMDVKSVL